MLHESLNFAEYQAAFAARIRNPRTMPCPPGAPARRMRVYDELLFNNFESFLLACYPVTRWILGARAWKQCIRRFFSEHRCHSPLFRDIPEAFLNWMEKHGLELFPVMPFLSEFMHYEWLELSVSVAPDMPYPEVVDPEGDMLSGCPALQPAARLACYHYPVHRIGPRFKPVKADGKTWCYLMYRNAEGNVRFTLLTTLSARLLVMIRDHQPSGNEALTRLIGNTITNECINLRQAGSELLKDLRQQGILLGTWREL